MLKDPSTFRKGMMFAVAWLAWFAAGVAYASANGTIKAFIANMPPQAKVFLVAWLLVSTTLLFYAIVSLIRGWTGQTGRTHSS